VQSTATPRACGEPDACQRALSEHAAEEMAQSRGRRPSIVSPVPSEFEAAVEEHERRAVALAVERETALLLDRLERKSEQLEVVLVELRDIQIDEQRARARIVEVERQLGAATLECEALRDELARTRAALELLERSYGHLERSYGQVVSSLSWRITGPLRWTKQALRAHR
jgi:chromosome segregation ATPase